MTEFFAMGGYAAFIWPAFAITAIVLAGLLMISLRGVRVREARLDALKNEERTDEA
jgi:heme exporter protein D